MSVSSALAVTVVDKPRRVWPERVFRRGQWLDIHTWTEEEDNRLRKGYRYTIQSLKDLGEEFGVSEHSVRGRLTRLGLLKLVNYKWTREEEEFLAENYDKLSAATIAKRLHKSQNAVVSKAYKLKVKCKVRDGWFSMAEAAGILGVDQSWIRRRVNNGFKFEMKPYDSEKPPQQRQYFPWYISERSLRDFIRRYPEELTGHNVDFVMLVDILAGVKSKDEKVIEK